MEPVGIDRFAPPGGREDAIEEDSTRYCAECEAWHEPDEGQCAHEQEAEDPDAAGCDDEGLPLGEWPYSQRRTESEEDACATADAAREAEACRIADDLGIGGQGTVGEGGGA